MKNNSLYYTRVKHMAVSTAIALTVFFWLWALVFMGILGFVPVIAYLIYKVRVDNLEQIENDLIQKTVREHFEQESLHNQTDLKD